MPEQQPAPMRADRREPPQKKKGKTAWQRTRFFLLLAIFPVAAAVGGVVFGQWLAMRAPVDQSAAAAAAAANGPVDLRGLPLANGSGVPEPPQPRMDGSRGVPSRVAATSKPIPVVSAGAAGAPVAPPGTTVTPGAPAAAAVAGLANDPTLHISTAPYVPSAAPAPGMPGGPPVPPASGVSGWMPQADLSPTPRVGAYSQVEPVNAGNDQNGLQPMLTQVSDAPPPPPPSQGLSVNSRPPVANMPAWQRVLRIALDRCEAQSSGRNACIQQARNNYCEANQGWGAIAECGP